MYKAWINIFGHIAAGLLHLSQQNISVTTVQHNPVYPFFVILWIVNLIFSFFGMLSVGFVSVNNMLNFVCKVIFANNFPAFL